MFCKQCGNSAPDGTRFCTHCGAELLAATSDPDTVPLFSTERNNDTQDAPPAASIPQQEYYWRDPQNQAYTSAYYPPTPPQTPLYGSTPAQVPVRTAVPAGPSAAQRVLSILLSILLFISLILSASLTFVRASLSESNFNKWVDTLDIASITVPAELGSGKAELVDYVYDMLKDCTVNNAEISRREIRKLLNDPLLKDFLRDSIEEYRSFLINSEDSRGITADMVVDYVYDHESEIRRAFRDCGMNEEIVFDYDELERMIDENIGDMLSIKTLAQNGTVNLPAIQFALSGLTMGILWFLTLLFAALLIVYNRAYISSSLQYIGIPVNIIGVIYLLSGIAMSVFIQLTRESVAAVIATMLSLFRRPTLILGAVLTIVGVLMMATSRVIKSVTKKRAAALRSDSAR